MKPLNDIISALMAMSGDVAKLEMTDNDQASRRIKQAIVDLKHNELDVFTRLIFDVRSEINSKPAKRKYVRRRIENEINQQI